MITIQRASAHDLDRLLPLFASYLRFYQKPVDAERIRAFLDARLVWGDSVIFIADHDAAAVGFVQLYPSFASLAQARSWILNDLFVNETARGHGVAQTLMQAARDLAVATDACELFLQTARDNAVAQRLYQRLGYQRDDEFLVYTLEVPLRGTDAASA